MYCLSNAKNNYGPSTSDRAVMSTVESKDKLCNCDDEVVLEPRPTISDFYDNGDSKYNTDIEIDEPIANIIIVVAHMYFVTIGEIIDLYGYTLQNS